MSADISERETKTDDDANNTSSRPTNLKITLISLHGLIRAENPELGRDNDTGGQVLYLLELARELAERPDVREVELLTRQVFDPHVDQDYAQREEALAENAKIVRIPFGPKRYLRKEALWPHLEIFIDHTLTHFKRWGLPDLIHAHYADAGLAGAQLARLLHIPFVFTAHSLGRVQRGQLSSGKADPDALENKHKFTTRIDAEEVALETAAMVVTNTSQEVQQHYELYDHYVPSRMEVIPPGVNMSSFAPRGDDWEKPALTSLLGRFLEHPEKPFILTVAQLDERKNLERLVDVYGQCNQLQELANLVMLMGTRDDYRDLPKAQQAIVESVFHRIDVHDLYGKVAYPKSIAANDLPDLYRYAESLKGVYVNPALSEPFGLTLLEAAATGLPIVATNDGGPRDIIANCKNGLLVDPLNNREIENALLRTLTEPEQWAEWSANGVIGTREHYSWANHVKRYLRNVTDILKHSSIPALRDDPRPRHLPEFDRLIIADLDNTLIGDDQSLQAFIKLVNQHDHIGFGIATRRRLDRTMALIDELGLPRPDLIETDCGTQLHYGEDCVPDRSWQRQIGYAWQPDEIRKVLDELPGIYPKDDENQSDYKISYEIDAKTTPSTTKIMTILREAGLRAKLILSHGRFLDVIPVRGGSDLSMRHVLWKWGFAPERVLVAGDSGNDTGMLLGRTLGVVVANHSKELDRLRNRSRVYFAKSSHAAGILEGIEYYNFLDQIIIPNDPID